MPNVIWKAVAAGGKVVVVTFTVKDSVTKTPIVGAYALLTCSLTGVGMVPYDGYSDANGVVSIDINGASVVSWTVTKSGYNDAGGSGTPPSTVYLQPLVYTLQIIVEGNGTTSPKPGTYQYNAGTQVKVTATPSSGYSFLFWYLDGVMIAQNPVTFTMDKDYTLIAYFTAAPTLITLTIDTTPVKGYVTIRENTASGRILAEGVAPVSYTSSEQFVYYAQFGDVPGYIKPNDISGLVTASKTITVEYTPIPVTYSNVTISITGQGTTDPPAGNYPSTYPVGSTLYVTAYPAEGWKYDHMNRNGVLWTTANPGEFSNLAETELIEVVFVATAPPPPPPPPPGMGTLECHAYIDTKEVSASVEIVGVGTYTTPFTENLPVGTYTLNATYDTQTKAETATIIEGKTVRVDFKFTKAPPLARITGPLGVWSYPIMTRLSQYFPWAKQLLTIITSRRK